MLQSTTSLLLLALPTLLHAIETTSSPVLCNGPYILCSTALCTTIPGNSTYVTCTCQGPYTGLNIGITTCDDRETYNISSFSFENTASNIYVFPCEGANAGPWAQCNGALCDVPEDGGDITCACPLEVGEHLYYGEECPSSEEGVQEACAMLRSTTDFLTNSNATTMDDDMAEELEEEPPTIEFCSVPGNGTS
ncbi:hypothetical protein M409DRAFT_22222 [Zasmidium cellare ATCC 36951]|uniref:Cyanovirin-N domain-containing protein n=1 Tax=Zasmidium cellare ATCC 36951 TaxID=1080233 RepID=A0A6A6CNB8_ZASCE|nr:uncharacterized protein M409DRAFT_22222 [Zasmidium cellare ATCC 36951]KAF2167412.1 hypothetical protein M409DRAFT_22222 [Zasmidium cellare ATCC 36951]